MKAEDQFVEEHTPLVKSIAQKLRVQLELTSDLDDLMAFGLQGLIEARTRYDPSRGVQFNTFAYYRIRGAILDGVRKMSYMPRRVWIAVKTTDAADSVLEGIGEARAAAPGGVREDVENTLDVLGDAMDKITASFLMSAVGQGPDDAPETPEETFVDAQQKERVEAVLGALPPREQRIVRAFYFENRPLDEIAKELKISKSWASRIHTKALELMKKSLDR